MMPKCTIIKRPLHDLDMSDVPTNSVCKVNRTDQAGTTALCNVRDLNTHDVNNNDAASNFLNCSYLTAISDVAIH